MCLTLLPGWAGPRNMNWNQPVFYKIRKSSFLLPVLLAAGFSMFSHWRFSVAHYLINSIKVKFVKISVHNFTFKFSIMYVITIIIDMTSKSSKYGSINLTQSFWLESSSLSYGGVNYQLLEIQTSSSWITEVRHNSRSWFRSLDLCNWSVILWTVYHWPILSCWARFPPCCEHKMTLLCCHGCQSVITVCILPVVQVSRDR